jgi:hypothetical protein
MPRTVLLVATGQAGQGHKRAKPAFQIDGELHLDVRNLEAFPVQLRVLYASADTGTLAVLPRKSVVLSIVSATPPQAHISSLAHTRARVS